MLDSNPGAARLRTLLERSTFGVGDEIIAEARSLGSELAGDVVRSLVERELPRPTADETAIRAAHLAHELRLVRAIPVLVRCIEGLEDVHPLGIAALIALARFGAQGVDELLAAFDRCDTREQRARIAETLLRTAVKDERIRAAFVRMLDDDPLSGAGYLAHYGDPRSVADLVRAMDRLALEAVGDCDICAGEHLVAMAQATRVLGGTPSEEQLTKILAVLRRHQDFWGSFGDTAGLPPTHAPSKRAPRPGRNARCHCGSGKKYKNCHLEADQRDAKH
jgi:SEC-C motif